MRSLKSRVARSGGGPASFHIFLRRWASFLCGHETHMKLVSSTVALFQAVAWLIIPSRSHRLYYEPARARRCRSLRHHPGVLGDPPAERMARMAASAVAADHPIASLHVAQLAVNVVAKMGVKP